MIPGERVYSKKHGIVTLLSKRYESLGNKVVWTGTKSDGKKVKLDGNEVPLSDHFDIPPKINDLPEKVDLSKTEALLNELIEEIKKPEDISITLNLV